MEKDKDSLEQAIGQEIEFELKGVKYLITQATVGDYHKLRSHVRSQRIKDFVDASLGLSTDIIQQTVRELASQIITDQELTLVIMTNEGQTFMLWRMLSHKNEHFKFTFDEFNELLDEDTMASMSAIMEGISDESEDAPADPPEAGGRTD